MRREVQGAGRVTRARQPVAALTQRFAQAARRDRSPTSTASTSTRACCARTRGSRSRSTGAALPRARARTARASARRAGTRRPRALERLAGSLAGVRGAARVHDGQRGARARRGARSASARRKRWRVEAGAPRARRPAAGAGWRPERSIGSPTEATLQRAAPHAARVRSSRRRRSIPTLAEIAPTAAKRRASPRARPRARSRTTPARLESDPRQRSSASRRGATLIARLARKHRRAVAGAAGVARGAARRAGDGRGRREARSPRAARAASRARARTCAAAARAVARSAARRRATWSTQHHARAQAARAPARAHRVRRSSPTGGRRASARTALDDVEMTASAPTRASRRRRLQRIASGGELSRVMLALKTRAGSPRPR